MTNFTAEFRGVQGKFIGTVNFGQDDNHVNFVDSESIVLASIVEIGAAPGQIAQFPMIGAADNIFIRNVCPQADSSVRFVIDTGWTGGPIDLRLAIAVNPV